MVKHGGGSDLYKSGIHFQACSDRINGFYLAESENESYNGSPIRVCFSGKFVEEDNTLFFDVYIYPRIIEFLFLIFSFVLVCVYGGIFGFIGASLVFLFFVKGYYDMMRDTFNILKRIFK